jgi:hypothetical protein
LFLEVPLQFLALWAAKRAFFSGKSLKTEVFRDSLHSLSLILRKMPAIFAAAIFLSCLQANYDEPILDYIPPPAGDVVSGLFSAAGSDMLIVTINGGTFQERLFADQFELRKGNDSVALNMPLRDSENRVIFSFDSSEALLAGGDYRLTVKSAALKDAASRVTVQAVKGGVWASASNTEGAFGGSLIWNIAYGSGRFVAVADEGKMAYSDDGQFWTAIRPGYGTIQSKFINTIRGIAWGDGKFIAVGYEGRMASSDNGLNWSGWTESIVGGNSLLCVTYGGGRFVAGGDYGNIVYMQDGGNWNGVQDSRFGDKGIFTLAWGNPGGRNVYVAAGKDGQLSWSNDAVNWTYADSGFGGQHIHGLAWGNGYFVAVGDSGRIARSTDGSTWYPVSGSAFGSSGIQSVSFGSGKFIAAGHDGKTASSPDGETWTSVNNLFDSDWQVKAVGYGGGKFTAAGHPYPPSTGCRIVYSYQPPQVIKAPTDKDSSSFNSKIGDNRLIISLTGGKFSQSAAISHFTVVGGTAGISPGVINGTIAEHGDTRVVIKLNNPPASNGTGQQINVKAGAFAMQPESIQVIAEKSFTWSAANSNPFGTSNISAIAYNGSNKYVAVGAGKIATSTDGKSWTEIEGAEKDKWANTDDYVFFKDIVYGNGKFVAVGYWVNGGENYAGWGTAAVSTDGASWVLTPDTGRILKLSTDEKDINPQIYSIAHNGLTGASSYFIAAGQWGRTAYSDDGSSWTAVQIGSFNYLDNPAYYENVLSIAYGNGIFAAAGGNGKVAYSEDNGLTWEWAANILLGNLVPINTVCFGDGKFIAAGNGGNMKIVSTGQIAPAVGSVNGGDNWQGVDSKFSDIHILSVAHNGKTGADSRFIAAGDNGKMSESSDGVNWMPIPSGSGPDQNQFGDREQISRIFWGGNKFIAGGYAYSGDTSKLTYGE